jgi:hypothetical protein
MISISMPKITWSSRHQFCQKNLSSPLIPLLCYPQPSTFSENFPAMVACKFESCLTFSCLIFAHSHKFPDFCMCWSSTRSIIAPSNNRRFCWITQFIKLFRLFLTRHTQHESAILLWYCVDFIDWKMGSESGYATRTVVLEECHEYVTFIHLDSFLSASDCTARRVLNSQSCSASRSRFVSMTNCEIWYTLHFVHFHFLAASFQNLDRINQSANVISPSTDGQLLHSLFQILEIPSTDGELQHEHDVWELWNGKWQGYESTKCHCFRVDELIKLKWFSESAVTSVSFRSPTWSMTGWAMDSEQSQSNFRSVR